ncbi:MAG: NUDIX domain-containing protein [Myxococcales bacterium]|nr:NUDIX domain-containing protein [Myxococcales bacterium]
MKQRRSPVRPRDAASLVMVRKHRGQPQVLMGKRPAKDRFMPDVYVFPGGRVENSDASLVAGTELPDRELVRTAARATRRRARMLAVAAVRETFEETGLLVGKRVAGEIRPDLDRLRLIARAITPTDSPIRYDARFFLVPGELAKGRLRSNGELLDLCWFSFEQARKLPIISVTELVLDEALYRLARRPFRGIPLIFWRGEATQVRYRREFG